MVKDNDKFLSSVKIGPKGQILIPKEAREMFGLMPGDNLVLLADHERGIALVKMDLAAAIADQVMASPAAPDNQELVRDRERFRKEMQEITEK